MQPVGWRWALFKNWARIIAMETAGYWVILEIWLLFSCLHGNWVKLKTWPWLGMQSTLKSSFCSLKISANVVFCQQLRFRSFQWETFWSIAVLCYTFFFLLLFPFSAHKHQCLSISESVPGSVCQCGYSLLILCLHIKRQEYVFVTLLFAAFGS